MYIDKENFVAWMERIMDRLDMQDKKIDRLLSGHNYLNGILPYLTLDGKYFYRASDIHKLIRERMD